MIRSLNLVTFYSRKRGGLFGAVRQLSLSLVEAGVGVEVISVEERPTPDDSPAWQPLSHHVCKTTWPHAFGYSPGISTGLRQVNPDILHTHGLWRYGSRAVHHYGQMHRTRRIVSPHGMLDSWAVRHSGWKKRIFTLLFERAHLREANCIRALCEAEAKAIRDYGLKNPICIIPNGVELPQLVESSELRVEGPLTALKADGRKVLLYLGRIHPKKGLVDLIKALAAVRRTEDGRRRTEEWVLAIAGWDQGGHEAELKCLATEQGIRWTDVRERESDLSVSAFQRFSVFFLGPQFGEAKAACYANCDAFILPSFSEGLPLVVLEAWAYGKPVLMTPECNLPEGFAAEAALRVEPTPASVTGGLLELFRLSSSDLHALGDNGRRVVASRFTWPGIAQEIKTIYEWVLGAGPRPDCLWVG